MEKWTQHGPFQIGLPNCLFVFSIQNVNCRRLDFWCRKRLHYQLHRIYLVNRHSSKPDLSICIQAKVALFSSATNTFQHCPAYYGDTFFVHYRNDLGLRSFGSRCTAIASFPGFEHLENYFFLMHFGCKILNKFSTSKLSYF